MILKIIYRENRTDYLYRNRIREKGKEGYGK